MMMERSESFRKFLSDKRGVELTLNTVIIAILIVLVLIVIIGFFLGGTNKMKDTIFRIFAGGTAGTDIAIAVEQCISYCNQAEDWSPTLQQTSPYCKFRFRLDMNNDGEADKSGDTGVGDGYGDNTAKDKEYIKYGCDDEPLKVQCKFKCV